MRKFLYNVLSRLDFLFFKKYNNRLRVLAYHKVPDEKAFEEQVIYLKSRFNIISIPQLIDHFENKTCLPKNPLLITFDDGDISVLEKGIPILKKFKLPSCLFIITELINTSKEVWIRRVEEGEMHKGKTYAQARQLVNHFKNIPNAERALQMKNYPSVKGLQLTTKDLKYLQNHGMYIANHTHTHPMLDKCSTAEIKEELQASLRIFNELGLDGYSVFAYPNGNANSETNTLLKNSNIQLIFLFDHKVNGPVLDPLNISRIRVDSDTGIMEFKAKVSGAHPFIYNMKK
jgi:poly-beta-1,6-N-acetyl-D-glucosamine N-deacetylase